MLLGAFSLGRSGRGPRQPACFAAKGEKKRSNNARDFFPLHGGREEETENGTVGDDKRSLDPAALPGAWGEIETGQFSLVCCLAISFGPAWRVA